MGKKTKLLKEFARGIPVIKDIIKEIVIKSFFAVILEETSLLRHWIMYSGAYNIKNKEKYMYELINYIYTPNQVHYFINDSDTKDIICISFMEYLKISTGKDDDIKQKIINSFLKDKDNINKTYNNDVLDLLLSVKTDNIENVYKKLIMSSKNIYNPFNVDKFKFFNEAFNMNYIFDIDLKFPPNKYNYDNWYKFKKTFLINTNQVYYNEKKEGIKNHITNQGIKNTILNKVIFNLQNSINNIISLVVYDAIYIKNFLMNINLKNMAIAYDNTIYNNLDRMLISFSRSGGSVLENGIDFILNIMLYLMILLFFLKKAEKNKIDIIKSAQIFSGIILLYKIIKRYVANETIYDFLEYAEKQIRDLTSYSISFTGIFKLTLEKIKRFNL